ncbi:MAG: ATP-binding protein [Chloroflexi bacterium]|nr:MAG: ATP-binding protein [Chloroflexota bacterium]
MPSARARIQRPSGAGTLAQTRAYAARAAALAEQLRREVAEVPDRPHGRPAVVMLMGLPGVGKSHVARLLCARLGAAHVATDELRSRLFIAAAYTDAENRAVFATSQALVEVLLGEGHRVVVDATNLLAPEDHSDADERVYERMRDRAFEPPKEGHLEVANGADLARDVARVAEAVEAATR